MLQDLDRDMKKWGTTGQFDPFDNIYKVSSTPTILFVLEFSHFHPRLSSNSQLVHLPVVRLQTRRRLSNVWRSSIGT